MRLTGVAVGAIVVAACGGNEPSKLPADATRFSEPLEGTLNQRFFYHSPSRMDRCRRRGTWRSPRPGPERAVAEQGSRSSRERIGSGGLTSLQNCLGL